MKGDKMIRAYVREEFMVSEVEHEFIKRYRKADKDVQEAINTLLEVDESDESEI